MPDLKLDDDLEGLSAEDLESLIEQDDGKAQLEVDDQNFVTEGIDELNAPVEANAEESGDEETPPAEEEEEETPAPVEESEDETVDEIDYEAEYNRQNAILARQQLLAAEASNIPTPPEQEPQLTGEELYQRELEKIKLSDEEQTKYDGFKEYDEEQAELYKQTIVNKKLLADVYKRNAEQEQQAKYNAEVARVNEEKSWNAVIAENKNMKKWQQNPEEWESVNSVFGVVSKTKGFGDLNKAEQIALVEKRYLAVLGQTVAEAPAAPAAKPKVDISEKIAKAEAVKPPSSLSSVTGSTDDGKPGRIKVDNGSDAIDLQTMFDNADPNDPEAIDKIMSSMDYGG